MTGACTIVVGWAAGCFWKITLSFCWTAAAAVAGLLVVLVPVGV